MKTLRILIVDDKEENNYLLRRLLQGNGYEVVTAAHGADALAKARQNPPDLVVSDILMPVMDGFALCREWKNDERLKPIPFVFYTATYTDERDREFALGLGAEKFVVKPQEPDELMAIIREVSRQAGRAPAAHANVPSAEEDRVFLKKYNATLIRKLEAKMEQLERTNLKLGQDIAARKKTEEALRASEERYRHLVERAPDVIYTLTAGGVISSLNSAFEKNTGWSCAEWIGKPFDGIVHPADAPAATKSFEASLRGEYPPPMEIRVRLKAGGWRICEITSSPFMEHGQIVGELGIARDITERKLAEQKIEEQLNELRRWNNALLDRESRVLALKHEVNELLLKAGQPVKYQSAEGNAGG